MQVYRTGDIATGFVKILVYGLAGAGKTPLASTCPNCLVVTSEPGLLSLRRANLPYVLGRDFKEAKDVHAWIVGSKEASKYQTIFFDSISALSETILSDQLRKSRDPRKYSPAAMQDTMEIVNLFFNLPNKHVVMTCKGMETQEEVSPAPGTVWKAGETQAPVLVKKVEPFAAVPKLGAALPYPFDEVFYLSRHIAPSNGEEYAALRCRENDFAKHTRDRSGALALWEPANISHIIDKINGVTKNGVV